MCTHCFTGNEQNYSFQSISKVFFSVFFFRCNVCSCFRFLLPFSQNPHTVFCSIVIRYGFFFWKAHAHTHSNITRTVSNADTSEFSVHRHRKFSCALIASCGDSHTSNSRIPKESRFDRLRRNEKCRRNQATHIAQTYIGYHEVTVQVQSRRQFFF